MQFRVDIDGTSEGRWMGHILSEIGCIWKSTSPEKVLALAKEETVKFYSWLERNGEPVPDLRQTLLFMNFWNHIAKK